MVPSSRSNFEKRVNTLMSIIDDPLMKMSRAEVDKLIDRCGGDNEVSPPVEKQQ